MLLKIHIANKNKFQYKIKLWLHHRDPLTVASEASRRCHVTTSGSATLAILSKAAVISYSRLQLSKSTCSADSSCSPQRPHDGLHRLQFCWSEVLVTVSGEGRSCSVGAGPVIPIQSVEGADYQPVHPMFTQLGPSFLFVKKTYQDCITW